MLRMHTRPFGTLARLGEVSYDTWHIAPSGNAIPDTNETAALFKELQRLVGVPADGIIGPATVKAVSEKGQNYSHVSTVARYADVIVNNLKASGGGGGMSRNTKIAIGVGVGAVALYAFKKMRKR